MIDFTRRRFLFGVAAVPLIVAAPKHFIMPAKEPLVANLFDFAIQMPGGIAMGEFSKAEVKGAIRRGDRVFNVWSNQEVKLNWFGQMRYSDVVPG